jgi:serine/threonine protein kinase
MSSLPDFSTYGYQVKRQLGCNLAGGRITYQAVNLATLQAVVIKQFQFAQSSSSWADYDMYQREIQLLRSLDHPGIPQYLESFQTDSGFCMVQEYIPAPSLAVDRSFTLAEVRTIAVKTLEILVYLQNRVPSIIHRDIKPDNILVSDTNQVYLVDFGFARIGHGEVGVSSVVKGTLGFMPPEQLFNRQLTEASDLYGLGITLICLLTHTQSIDVGKLIDITYRINFRTLLPHLSAAWLNWLEKLVEPRLGDRFPNAAIALASIPDTTVFAPQVRLSTSMVQFNQVPCGRGLSAVIRVQNPIPQTELQGEWQVVPHPSDPALPPSAQVSHAWISFTPQTVQSNDVECQIWIDTTRLIPGCTYVRELCLRTNAAHSNYHVTLQVQTKADQKVAPSLPYTRLALLWGGAIAGTWILGILAQTMTAIAGVAALSITGTAAGIVVGLEMAAGLLALSGAREGAAAGGIAGIAGGFLILAMIGMNPVDGVGMAGLMGVVFGLIYGLGTGLGAGVFAESLMGQGVSHPLAIALVLLVIGWGSSLALGFLVGMTVPWVGMVVGVTGFSLLAIALWAPLRRLSLQRQTRRHQRRLIKP